MDRTKWIQRLKGRLGSPVVKVYVTDEMIEEYIAETIDKVKPYLKEYEYIDSHGPVVDLTEYKPLCVLRVLRATSAIPSPAMGLMDEFAVVNFAPYFRTGSHMAEVMVSNIYRSEVSSLIPEDWKLVENFLYISGYIGRVTIEAITENSIEKMDDKYQQWCFEYFGTT